MLLIVRDVPYIDSSDRFSEVTKKFSCKNNQQTSFGILTSQHVAFIFTILLGHKVVLISFAHLVGELLASQLPDIKVPTGQVAIIGTHACCLWKLADFWENNSMTLEKSHVTLDYSTYGSFTQ